MANNGGRSKFLNLDVTKVCNDFVKPLTSNLKSSYCDYLMAQDLSATGEAQVFVCLVWTYKFLDLIDTGFFNQMSCMVSGTRTTLSG